MASSGVTLQESRPHEGDHQIAPYDQFQHVELPSYGLACFDHLVGEYRGLSCKANIEPDTKKTADELVQIYISGSRKLRWSDLCTFEGLLLQCLTGPELRERLWAVESRYESLASGSEYQEHVKNVPLDVRNASEEELRARVRSLNGELHRLYIISVCRESMRDVASNRLKNAMIAFFGLFAIVYFAQRITAAVHNGDIAQLQLGVSTISAVLFAGAMGGFISSQRRLQGVSKRGESMIDLIELSSRTAYWLAPVTGAVFASVLFMMIAGGFLSGQLFPTVSSPIDKTTDGLPFALFARATGPQAGVDWAKLLIWSFIAGFAERFVPDALDRVVARSQDKATAAQ